MTQSWISSQMEVSVSILQLLQDINTYVFSSKLCFFGCDFPSNGNKGGRVSFHSISRLFLKKGANTAS